jgi:hypothetical protein
MHLVIPIDDRLNKYRAWAADDKSDPDLYLKVDDPDVTLLSYHWRSANIGADRIDVLPTDP